MDERETEPDSETPNRFSVEGERVIVTGASSGIGRTVAEQFAAGEHLKEDGGAVVNLASVARRT